MDYFLRQKFKIGYDYFLYLWFRYHSVFFGSLIFHGKKISAFNRFLDIKYGLKVKEGVDVYLAFLIPLIIVTPDIRLAPLKLGGITHGVPVSISESKKITFAVKWIVKSLKDKERIITTTGIINLLIASSYGKGLAIEKKLSLHKLGIKNRHLLRYFK